MKTALKMFVMRVIVGIIACVCTTVASSQEPYQLLESDPIVQQMRRCTQFDPSFTPLVQDLQNPAFIKLCRLIMIINPMDQTELCVSKSDYFTKVASALNLGVTHEEQLIFNGRNIVVVKTSREYAIVLSGIGPKYTVEQREDLVTKLQEITLSDMSVKVYDVLDAIIQPGKEDVVRSVIHAAPNTNGSQMFTDIEFLARSNQLKDLPVLGSNVKTKIETINTIHKSTIDSFAELFSMYLTPEILSAVDPDQQIKGALTPNVVIDELWTKQVSKKNILSYFNSLKGTGGLANVIHEVKVVVPGQKPSECIKLSTSILDRMLHSEIILAKLVSLNKIQDIQCFFTQRDMCFSCANVNQKLPYVVYSSVPTHKPISFDKRLHSGVDIELFPANETWIQTPSNMHKMRKINKLYPVNQVRIPVLAADVYEENCDEEEDNDEISIEQYLQNYRFETDTAQDQIHYFAKSKEYLVDSYDYFEMNADGLVVNRPLRKLDN